MSFGTWSLWDVGVLELPETALLLNKRIGEDSHIRRKTEMETDDLRFGLSFRLKCVSDPIKMVDIIWQCQRMPWFNPQLFK